MQSKLTGVFVRTNGWGLHYPNANRWSILPGGELMVLGEDQAIEALARGVWLYVGWAKDHGEDIENIAKARALQDEQQKAAEAQRTQLVGGQRGN